MDYLRRIMAAMENTIAKAKGHWVKLLTSRAQTSHQGSFYLGCANGTEVEKRLVHALATATAAQNIMLSKHANIKAPAVGFIIPLQGVTGIVAVDQLHAQEELVMRVSHVPGQVDLTVYRDGGIGDTVGHTTILLGPLEDGSEGIWTFHPGDPINPANLQAETYPPGTVMRAEIAKSLGLAWAKAVEKH